MNQSNNLKHLLLNSNPWFSAVSDYSLQLAIYLNERTQILYCSELGSTAMNNKCKEFNIPFENVPIHNQSFFKFFKSFLFLYRLFLNNKDSLKYIWVFEGREHSLCAISKICFPFLWKNKVLIRVRGQAQSIRSNIFSKFMYNIMTNKIVFAADCIKKRVQFDIPDEKTIIQYYAKNFNSENLVHDNSHKSFYIDNSFPPVRSENLLYIVIGRFDKVKGHDYLLDAFLNADFKDSHGEKIKSQMLFLGYNANIKANKMYDKYLIRFGEGIYTENKYYLKSASLNKELYIVNEKIQNIDELMRMAHFGVIPSLDSEVICRVGVEFLQCGTPVISSNAGALPEVFSDFNHSIFQVGDTEQLKNCLVRASQIYLDKERHCAKREKAKRIGFEKFSLKNYDKLIDFINKV